MQLALLIGWVNTFGSTEIRKVGYLSICTEKSLFGVRAWRFAPGRLLAQQICGSKLPHSKVSLLNQA